MIIGGSGSGKATILLNLINEQDDLDKIYLYAKDLSESKYRCLIQKRKDVWIKYLNDLNAFIESFNPMDEVYENIDDYNPNRKRKILIAFDDMVTDIMSDKKVQVILKELFIRWRKLNISLIFYHTDLFYVPKDVRLNSTHYLIMKIKKKKRIIKYCN